MTLEEMRRNAFFSQDRVAKELNVTSATIGNWERGRKRPRLMYIPMLAKLYGVTTQQIQAAIELALSAAGNKDAEEE
jgi:DNA-binding XRE family transcriptional regulator